jgi:hypothetical protein
MDVQTASLTKVMRPHLYQALIWGTGKIHSWNTFMWISTQFYFKTHLLRNNNNKKTWMNARNV